VVVRLSGAALRTTVVQFGADGVLGTISLCCFRFVFAVFVRFSLFRLCFVSVVQPVCLSLVSVVFCFSTCFVPVLFSICFGFVVGVLSAMV
jgi:hypothetical protein